MMKLGFIGVAVCCALRTSLAIAASALVISSPLAPERMTELSPYQPGARLTFSYQSHSTVSKTELAQTQGDSSLPMVAIVIDDYGPNFDVAQKILALGPRVKNMTHTVMPSYVGTSKTVELFHQNDLCFLLHLPMQAVVDPAGSRQYLIGTDTSDEKIDQVIQKLLPQFKGLYGVNNHRGSKATSDPRVVKALAKTMKKNGLFFLDSHTSAKTLAWNEMKKQGVPTLRNHVFLDGTTNVATMKAQFKKAVGLAKKNGHVVAICHCRPSTLPFLKWLCTQNFPDVRFVTVKQLAQERN